MSLSSAVLGEIMAYYRINGLSGFNGLIVEGEYRIKRLMDVSSDFIMVRQFINQDTVVGDRNIKFPLPEGSLYISDKYLIEIDDPGTREYAIDNPFGELLFEGHLKRDALVIDYVQYNNAVSVTVREDHGNVGRTVYTQNYFGEKSGAAMRMASEAVQGLIDVEDLVFSLKELHARKEEH